MKILYDLDQQAKDEHTVGNCQTLVALAEAARASGVVLGWCVDIIVEPRVYDSFTMLMASSMHPVKSPK